MLVDIFLNRSLQMMTVDENVGIPAGFGMRLREERKRLKKTQVEFAQAGGVGRLAQIQYENETTVPTIRYINGIATLGADVPYLLLGMRLAGGPLTSAQENRINREAFDLIEVYAKRQAGGQLSAESRLTLFEVLRRCLIQKELGQLPPTFDPVSLISDCHIADHG